MIYIREILSKEDFTLFDDYPWEDGLKSTTSEPNEVEGDYGNNVKRNFESYDENLDLLIMSKLNSDLEFHRHTVAKSSTKIILSKTIQGGYYNVHIDKAYLGDYSTTLFLQDPDEYEGGELVLKIDGVATSYKLPYGHAITYPSGTIHQVNEVTSGVRYAAVFWTSSHIRDLFDRSLYSDIMKIAQYFPDDTVNTIDDYDTHPKSISRTLLEKMSRKYFR